MTSLLHLAAGADALLAAITTAWAALGEIVTAGALLWLLNQLANLTRLAYRAGFILGRLLWPLLHLVAHGLQLIDWRFAALVALDAAKVLLAFTVAAAQAAQPALVKASACLGRAYACLLVGAQAAATVTAAPAVHPLAELAADLEQLTNRQLQAITGCRRRVAKQQLVALALVY